LGSGKSGIQERSRQGSLKKPESNLQPSKSQSQHKSGNSGKHISNLISSHFTGCLTSKQGY
jgi:hypothetical protein